MNYEQAEQEIYARLLPLEGAEIDVVKLAENETDFKRPFNKAKFTICYKGSKWKDPQSTSHISQCEELLFEIAIQSRTLRGSRGIYTLKRILSEALVGFRPTDCDRMYAKESGMINTEEVFKDGVWTYSVIFACTNLSVEDFEEDISVLLKKITLECPTTGDTLVVESSED